VDSFFAAPQNFRVPLRNGGRGDVGARQRPGFDFARAVGANLRRWNASQALQALRTDNPHHLFALAFALASARGAAPSMVVNIPLGTSELELTSVST